MLIVMFGLVADPSMAQEPSRHASDSGAGQGSLAELGAKLSNPLSDVWALFTEFDVNWSEGDISDGEHKIGGDMLFQPVMPFKLTEGWKLITRPVVPVVLGTPVPDGINESQGGASFDYKQGLGDIQVPLLFSPNPKPGGRWMFGGGPTFVLPTATTDELGADKWQADRHQSHRYLQRQGVFRRQMECTRGRDRGEDNKVRSSARQISVWHREVPGAPG
jgi:hypothetical protein